MVYLQPHPPQEQGVPCRPAKMGHPWFCSKHFLHLCLRRGLALGQLEREEKTKGSGRVLRTNQGPLRHMDPAQASRGGRLHPPEASTQDWGGGARRESRLSATPLASQETSHLTLGGWGVTSPRPPPPTFLQSPVCHEGAHQGSLKKSTLARKEPERENGLGGKG